jgi:CBS domain-containing protein
MFDFDVRQISEVDQEAERSREAPTLAAIALDTPVGEVPRGPAVTLAPEATVATAIETMRRRARGAAVVVRQHRPVGVVTDRDILAHAFTTIEDLGQLPLSAVMVPCAAPLRERDTVGAALRRMCGLGRWHLPLVCDRGLVLGTIDFTDLASWLRDRMIVLSVDAAFD